MSFIIFLLTVAAGYAAFKRKSALAFAGAGALAAFWFIYESEIDLMYNIEIVTSYRWPWLAIGAAIGYVGFSIWQRGKSGRTVFGDSTNALDDMQLLVGRVLDTRTNHTVFSNTTVQQNAFGNLESHTSHDVQVSHNTWLYDINRDTDVTYSGNGNLQARPGHIFGTMSWKGRSFLDINYSTSKKFVDTGTKYHPVASLVWGGILVAFGWAMFPLFALMSPLVWAGWINWNGNGGIYTKNVVPGSHKIEALLTYGGGLIYLAAFAFMMTQRRSDDILTALIVGYAALTALHYFVVKKIAQSQEELIARGETELDKLYASGMARQNARAAAEAQAAQAAVVAS